MRSSFSALSLLPTIACQEGSGLCRCFTWLITCADLSLRADAEVMWQLGEEDELKGDAKGETAGDDGEPTPGVEKDESEASPPIRLRSVACTRISDGFRQSALSQCTLECRRCACNAVLLAHSTAPAHTARGATDPALRRWCEHGGRGAVETGMPAQVLQSRTLACAAVTTEALGAEGGWGDVYMRRTEAHALPVGHTRQVPAAMPVES